MYLLLCTKCSTFNLVFGRNKQNKQQKRNKKHKLNGIPYFPTDNVTLLLPSKPY